MVFAINVNDSAYKDHPRSRDAPRTTMAQIAALVETEPVVPRRARGTQSIEVPMIDPVRELDQDLAHMNHQEMMADLAASLAHEITEPIAALKLSAEACLRWIKRDPPDLEEVRQVLLRIIKDAKRAANIVERSRSLYGERRNS
jgi:signal transduction histidine kinase